MLSLKVFSFMGEKLRVIVKDNVPWFVGADVLKMCGVKTGTGNYSRALKCIPESERSTLAMLFTAGLSNENTQIALKGHYVDKTSSYKEFFTGFQHRSILVTESGMYRLIMRGETEKAKLFQNWVCGEVLPSLRENGSYSIPNQNQSQQESKQLSMFDDNEIMPGTSAISFAFENGGMKCEASIKISRFQGCTAAHKEDITHRIMTVINLMTHE